MFPFFSIFFLIVGFVAITLWLQGRAARRADFIRTYMFPPGLLDKLGAHQPRLGVKERQIVARALRQFFLAYLKSGHKQVAMPSQVADELWHEFILHTRQYHAFCKQAFGRYLHHTPASVLGGNRDNNAALRRVWWHCCIEENINPRTPTRLPLLFALDAKFNIANGFRYEANCRKLRTANGANESYSPYCGSDFASTGVDGSCDGFGDGGPVDSTGSDSSSSCSGGCSGGCGGGGD